MEKINDKLPVIELLIEKPDDGTSFVSAVHTPAFQNLFMAFNDHKQESLKQSFYSLSDDAKKEIANIPTQIEFKASDEAKRVISERRSRHQGKIVGRPV